MKIAFVQENVHYRDEVLDSISMDQIEICTRLAKEHEIYVIADSPPFMPPEVATWYRCCDWQAPRALKLPLFIARSSAMVWGLRDKFDLVVAQVSEGCLNFNADVIDVHGISKRETANTKGELRIPPIKHWQWNVYGAYTEHLLRRRHGRIIVHSEGVRRDTCLHFGLSPSDIAVVPLGVDLERFSPENRERHRSQVRRELTIPEEAFVILFVGASWLRKKLHLVINSLAVMKNAHIYLVIVGQGSMAELGPYLRDDIDWDKVRFVPPAECIERYYAVGDVLVLPSSYETFSRVSYEAAAAGLPVLATKLPGIEDLIEDGENGFFLQPDAQHIASKVAQLYSSPQLRLGMGARAREKAMRFSWDETARKMESALLEIHQKGRLYAEQV